MSVDVSSVRIHSQPKVKEQEQKEELAMVFLWHTIRFALSKQGLHRSWEVSRACLEIAWIFPEPWRKLLASPDQRPAGVSPVLRHLSFLWFPSYAFRDTLSPSTWHSKEILKEDEETYFSYYLGNFIKKIIFSGF